MKVVVAHRTGEVRVLDIAQPALAARTVLVRVTHCAISTATELTMVRQVRRYLQSGEDGIPLGYSCSGVVESVGEDVSAIKAGVRVACYGAPYVYHAEFLSVPENLVVELPKKVNFEEGSFTGIGAISVHAYHQADARLGEVVAIFGGGLLGNLVGQVCRAAGAKVLMVDDQEGRLQKARNVGIPHTARLGSDALTRTVAQLSDGLGVDTAILCCDSENEIVQQAVEVLRERGRLVVAGGGELRFPREALYFKEAEVRMARAAGPGRYDPNYERDGKAYPLSYVRWTERENMKLFTELLNERRVQVSPLITDRVPLERAASAYEKLLRGLESCYAVTLTV
jgi:threonine dehydrogenase-like Zn-dependent dehydrogenase